MSSNLRVIQPHRRPAFFSSSAWQAALVVLCGSMCCASATAALSDTLHPYAGVTYTTDDNLFRVPDGVEPGPEGRSDTMRQAMFGIQVDRPFGRQRLEANVKLSKVDFNKYEQLNYSGKDADATLHWRIGNLLSGDLGGSYSETLAPFNDFHSTERNLRVHRNGFVSAAYLFHPSWQVRGTYVRDQFAYDLLSQKYLDRTETSTEVGFDYLAASGSTIGLLARRSKGEYPDDVAGGFFTNEDYKQDAYRLKILWLLSAQSRVEFQGGHTSRKHVVSGYRDASGTNGRLTATWSPRAALKFVGSAWREFTPYEGSLTSFSLNRGASLRGTWAVLDRLSVDAQWSTIHRDFDTPRIGNVIYPGFGDNSRTGSVGVNYVFRDHIGLGAAFNRDTRSIDRRFGVPYRSNGGSVYINLQF